MFVLEHLKSPSVIKGFGLMWMTVSCLYPGGFVVDSQLIVSAVGCLSLADGCISACCVQVLSNLSQHGSMGQIPSPTAHSAQQAAPMRMVPSQMSHSMPSQTPIMPHAAATSMPPGMMMHGMPAGQMQAQQQAQQQQQHQAAAAMQHNSMQGMPQQSMPPGSRSGGYPMQQMNMLDDPLMTTLH